MPDSVFPDGPLEFKMLEKGSKRGGKLLVFIDGFSYGIIVSFLLLPLTYRNILGKMLILVLNQTSIIII